MAVVVCFLFYVSWYKNIFRRTLDARASFLFLKGAKSFLKGNLSTLKKKKKSHFRCVLQRSCQHLPPDDCRLTLWARKEVPQNHFCFPSQTELPINFKNFETLAKTTKFFKKAVTCLSHQPWCHVTLSCDLSHLIGCFYRSSVFSAVMA